MARDLRDHLPKLYRAEIPVTVALASVGEPPLAGSEAERQLAERFKAVRKIRQQEAPGKALRDRQRALHVDWVQHAPGWNRPCQVVSYDDADYYVGAADARYGLLRLQLKRDRSEVGKAVWKWVKHLELPSPPWDVFTWRRTQASGIKPRSA